VRGNRVEDSGERGEKAKDYYFKIPFVFPLFKGGKGWILAFARMTRELI